MADRWYYQHAGRTQGPVTEEQLRLLAASRQLAPADPIWRENQDRSRSVPAQTAIAFPKPGSPNWLEDVRTLEEAPASTSTAETLDWLDDVREVEEAFLNIPWDNEAALIEEKAAEELLHEPPASAPTPSSPKAGTPSAPVLLATPVTAIAKPAAPASASCRLAIGSATTRGRVRDRNEDSLLVQQCTWSNLDRRRDLALVVVADGMGGHQAGDRATGLVIRAMGGALAPLLSAVLSGQSPPARATLVEAFDRGLHEANRIVLQIAKDDDACKGMGSTAVALLVWDGRAFINLVGDCRVYHWRAGRLAQVTRDQTLVARMVELGQLTPQEAATHPKRSEVTQAVGKFNRIEPARYERELNPGDWLIASCDGLYAHVEDHMLGEAIAKAGPSAAGLANQLVEMANQGGGSDNCTVVAVHCE